MKVSPWAAAHSLSNDTVSTLVADQFSVLRPARVTGRYEGWDNEAFEINNQWIFRFPKRAEGELLLRREIALLPRLSKTLPLPVPEYSFIGTPGPAYPYAFAGYEKLNGIPAIELSTPQSETIPLAGLLGCFLSSVHSFPALDAQKLGIVQAEVDPGVAIAEARRSFVNSHQHFRPIFPVGVHGTWRIISERICIILVRVGCYTVTSVPNTFYFPRMGVRLSA